MSTSIELSHCTTAIQWPKLVSRKSRNRRCSDSPQPMQLMC